MSPARPFHVNHPHFYANGKCAESDQYYEVVGHRDGPVVARFYFYPDDSKSQDEALAGANELADKNKKEPHD